MKCYASLILAFILRGTGASVVTPESEKKSSIRRAKILQNTLDSTEAADMTPTMAAPRNLQEWNTDDDFTYHPTLTGSPTWSNEDDDFFDDDFEYDTAYFYGSDDNGEDDDNYWPTMSPTDSFCPEPDTPATFSLNGNKYFFNERDITWSEHAACARQWGGKLSSIDTTREQKFIKNRITAIIDRDLRVFIGGKKVGRNWMWSDKADMQFSNWAAGEPLVHAKKVRIEMDFTTDEGAGRWMAVKGGEWRTGLYKK